MNLYARFISWLNNQSVGDIRYRKASPFIVGSLVHFLPTELWTNKEKNLLRYRFHKERWAGTDWEFVETLEHTRAKWKEIYENDS